MIFYFEKNDLFEETNFIFVNLDLEINSCMFAMQYMLKLGLPRKIVFPCLWAKVLLFCVYWITLGIVELLQMKAKSSMALGVVC